MASKKRASRRPVKALKKVRRYGATVYAAIPLEMTGLAVKALEHAPDVQVVDIGELEEDPSRAKIQLRSLEFPRFWEGSEVDIFGDVERGLVVLQHPATEDE